MPPIRMFRTRGWTAQWLALSRLSRAVSRPERTYAPQFEYAAAGSTGVLQPDEPVAWFTGPRGQAIFLPARVLYRIEQDQLAPDAIDRLAFRVLSGSLIGCIANGLPDDVGSSRSESQIEIVCDRVIGHDSVAERRQLVAGDSISKSDADAIEPFRPAVVELNLFGDESDMRQFVADANGHLGDTLASFAVIGHSIVARYRIPSLPCSVVTLTVEWSEREGSVIGEIRGMHPGRARQELPAALPFFRRKPDRSFDAFAALDRLAARLPPQSQEEREAVAAQRRAQEFWWRHALLKPGVGGPDRGERPGR